MSAPAAQPTGQPTGQWRARSVLVTGATGMVGSWLTRRLVDEGAHVTALVCDHDPQSELIRSATIGSISVVDGQLESFDAVKRAINSHECDTVIHLGAQTIVTTAHRDPMATLEANVRGTWHVLEAARSLGGLVQRVVVASSDKAYGTAATLPYLEGMALHGDHPYEVSKSCTDLIAQMYAKTYGLPVTIARCGNIYGGGDLNWSRIVPGAIRALFRGEALELRSDGTFLRDYLHVDDVVDAYLTLAEQTPNAGVRGQAFNFSDEQPLSVLDIYDAVCRAVGTRIEPRVLGSAVGEIKDQYLDASKARSVLGWKAGVTLDEGMARTVSWYRGLLLEGAARS